MPLNFVNIRPGFNKQITATAAEGQYIDGDNVRFRYGLPEKIGGWEQLTAMIVTGKPGLIFTKFKGMLNYTILTSRFLLILFA